MTSPTAQTQKEDTSAAVNSEEKPREEEVPAEAEGEAEPQLLVEEEEETLLHNLCILPPLQKDGNDDLNEGRSIANDAVLLPSISATEPVSAIRGAIAEIRGYAHMTNYRLVIEDVDEELHKSIIEQSKKKKEISEAMISVGNGGKKKKKKGASNGKVSTTDIVSPYTSSKAAIKVASSLLSLDSDPTFEDTKHEEVVLNEFGDLTSYVESNGLASNMGFRIVLERYDVGLVKEHVIKTRYLLDGNAPCVLRVVGEEGDAKSDDKDTEENDENAKVSVDVTSLFIYLYY